MFCRKALITAQDFMNSIVALLLLVVGEGHKWLQRGH